MLFRDRNFVYADYYFGNINVDINDINIDFSIENIANNTYKANFLLKNKKTMACIGDKDVTLYKIKIILKLRYDTIFETKFLKSIDKNNYLGLVVTYPKDVYYFDDDAYILDKHVFLFR